MDKVIVKIIGSQTDGTGEVNRIELMAEGRHYYRNGKHYVLYDDAMTNKDQKTATVLKIAANSLTLLRKGDVMQEQYFQPQQEHSSVYRTPYGNLDLAVRTEKINIVYGTVSGNIDVAYAMSVNGQWQSSNELHIEISAADTESRRLN